jgi:hypothetical protein
MDMADIIEDLPDDEGEGKRNYDVGYGKPPVSGRFKPGQSGNPRGRRKGQPNRKTFTEQELGRRQWVTVDGKRRYLSNWELAMLSQIMKARKGDPKAFRTLLDYVEGLGRDTESQAQHQGLAPEEREAMKRHLDYIRKKRPEDGHEP